MTTELRTIDPGTLTHLRTWEGKSEIVFDSLTAAPVRGLHATLDHDDIAAEPGSALPALWHWLYFLPQHRQREIGPDGHPTRGGFLPPVPLPRRMWAGGRLHWAQHNPLLVGDALRRVSTIQSVKHKAGRTGDLLFVVVQHQVFNERGLAITEEHDIVYRAAATPQDPVPAPVAAPTGAIWHLQIVPDDVLLFRYSALTFNGHRIHYDRRYVTGVEGYPGLIVHGPLIATLLADLVHRHVPGAVLRDFEFKAVRPTFDLHSFHVNATPSDDGKSIQLWANDHEGWLTMQATAQLG
jgi:3-methylfumaryl-CoA hydratase